ncbi:phage tail protein [Staphylococcus hominis]|uniref:phage tail protein n=1 Tax=Staphylococcus hominis TaxID=1290 RepID=UPI0022E1C114|nr:phage tail protein [Staphylococcus hominis]
MAEANYSIKAQIEANTRKFKSAIQSAKKVAQSFKKTQESIKDTKLDGDASGVKKAVESAKASVKSFDNTEGKAELDIDSSKLREQVKAAKGIVNSFDHLHADAELSADIKRARTNIEALEHYIDNVDNKDADVDISADVSKAMKRLDILRTNLSSITNKNYDATITADATRAREAIKRAKHELNDFAKQRAKAKLDVNMKAASSKVEIFKAMLRSIPNVVRTRLEVDSSKSLGFFKSLGRAIDESTRTWDKLATKIRTIGTVLGNMIKGVLISNISLLVPAIASLVPALMAVLNAIGVVSGGALGLAGAFGVAGAGAVAFGAMGISALTMLADGTLEATKETERYEASLDSLKSAWADLIKQNQAQIFNTLANSIDTAKVALAGLTPFINGVSKGMEQASAKVLDWAKNSQVAQKFFEMMGTTGVRIFNNMLDAAGSFGSGLVSVLTQIAPLAEWVSQGFKKMGQAFNEWAQSVEGQNAIKSFIEYTKQNLPLIGQIFGSTFRGIFNLMKAFAPNTHLVLQGLADMAKQFEQWSSTIAESDGFKKFIEYVQENGPKLIQLIGNIINIIINVATAMAPFASAVLDVANAMTDFIAKLTEAHPAIGIMLGLIATLAGIFMTLGPPILGAIDFIGTFIKAITGAGTVMEAFSAIGSAISGVLDTVALAFMYLEAPILLIVGAVAAVIAILVWLWNTNESVRNALTNAWDVISSTIGGAIQSVIDWFMQLYENIMQTIQPLMPIFQQFGDMINQILGVVVVQAINFLVEAFKSLWLAVSVIFTAIGAIVSSVIQLIVGLFTAFIQLITGDFTGALQTLQTTFWNVLNTIWTAVQSIFTQISEFIFASLNSILGTSISSWSQIFSSTYQFLSQIFSSVAQWFGQVAQTIASKMAQALGYIISNGSQWVSSIASTLASFVSSVISGFVRVVSSVAQYMAQGLSRVISGGSQWVSSIISAMARFLSSVISGFSNVASQTQAGMQRAYSTIVGFVGQFASAGMDLMRGLVQGIMNGMSWVVNAARNVAKSAVNAAKSALGIHSPSRVFKEIGGYTMQGFGIGIDKEGRSVVSGMGSMANSITDAFNSNLAVPDITSNMKKVNANMNAQVQHTHTIQTNPSQRVVRIEMDVNNEALEAIVNGQTANDDTVFSF